MAGTIQDIQTDQEFDQLIASGTVLVDFYATWCAPCRMQLPILEQVAEQVGDAAQIAKVNVDNLPGLASRYGVSGIPHLTLLKDGDVVNEFVGMHQGPPLIAAIQGAAN